MFEEFYQKCVKIREYENNPDHYNLNHLEWSEFEIEWILDNIYYTDYTIYRNYSRLETWKGGLHFVYEDKDDLGESPDSNGDLDPKFECNSCNGWEITGDEEYFQVYKLKAHFLTHQLVTEFQKRTYFNWMVGRTEIGFNGNWNMVYFDSTEDFTKLLAYHRLFDIDEKMKKYEYEPPHGEITAFNFLTAFRRGYWRPILRDEEVMWWIDYLVEDRWKIPDRYLPETF